MKPVIVYSWLDYCEEHKEKFYSEAQKHDPTEIRNHQANIQEWHKGLICKHGLDYEVNYCDSSGLLVLVNRKLI